MSTVPADRKYTKEHEWALQDPVESDVLVIGISDYAQAQLGDVVMVELPEIGDEVEKDDVFGAVESPKSVSDLFSPVSGEVVAVNEDLLDQPERVNTSPYEDGWIVRLRMTDPSELGELLDSAGYVSFCDDLDG